VSIADAGIIRAALADRPEALAEFERHIQDDRDAIGYALAANIGPIRLHALGDGEQPRPILYDGEEERLAAALSETPSPAGLEPYVLRERPHEFYEQWTRAIIERLREGR
jgi:hypothetical protein